MIVRSLRQLSEARAAFLRVFLLLVLGLSALIGGPTNVHAQRHASSDTAQNIETVVVVTDISQLTISVSQQAAFTRLVSSLLNRHMAERKTGCSIRVTAGFFPHLMLIAHIADRSPEQLERLVACVELIHLYLVSGSVTRDDVTREISSETAQLQHVRDAARTIPAVRSSVVLTEALKLAYRGDSGLGPLLRLTPSDYHGVDQKLFLNWVASFGNRSPRFSFHHEDVRDVALRSSLPLVDMPLTEYDSVPNTVSLPSQNFDFPAFPIVAVRIGRTGDVRPNRPSEATICRALSIQSPPFSCVYDNVEGLDVWLIAAPAAISETTSPGPRSISDVLIRETIPSNLWTNTISVHIDD